MYERDMATARPSQDAFANSANLIPITIYSDVICPWCYVGKRRFEAGVKALGLDDRFAISWKPFELNPDMPSDGMERAAYRARKFGAERAAQLDAQMVQTGAESGIPFAFDKMARTPNTRAAHRLIWWAGEQGSAAQNALVERLFKGYFEEAQDIGNPAVLMQLVSEAGLDPVLAGDVLSSDASLDAVLDLEAAGRRMGIQGVPFFILIDKYALSGAQPAETWEQALPQILAEAAA
jgi:predicted DsbA family dithiol-disulfide isomerase